MIPEEQSGGAGSAPSRRSGPPRRRRSFRPGPRPPRRNQSPPTQGSAVASSQNIEERGDTRERVEEPIQPSPEPVGAPEESQDFRLPPQERAPNALAGPAIQEAIAHLQRMNKDLEELLLEMQKTLETLEEAEVQKYADEREIESLRAAIRQLTRTRENRENHSRAPQGRQDSGRQDPGCGTRIATNDFKARSGTAATLPRRSTRRNRRTHLNSRRLNQPDTKKTFGLNGRRSRKFLFDAGSCGSACRQVALGGTSLQNALDRCRCL